MVNARPIVLISLLGVAAAAAAALYFTRPAAAPSVPVEQENYQLASTTGEGELLYRFSPANARASYSIYEELRSQPNTVVGQTAEVAGELALNMLRPTESRLGTFRVNARTLVTDSERRDGAVARFILKSEDSANEFITFVPASLSGFAGPIVEGQPFTFQASGNLTVAGVTKLERFDIQAILQPGERLLATATARILRSNYSLAIPQLEFIANVGDEVTLEVTVDAPAEVR